MADFTGALRYCLENEGGFANKSADRGGPTNKGVTLAMFAKYRGRMVSIPELQNISDNDLYNFYNDFFWTPLKISGLPQNIATAILDTAILQGQDSAIKLAQKALGNHVLPDGLMGPNTLKALDVADPQEFIYNYIGEIQNKFVRICIHAANQLEFLEDWLKRSRRLFLLIEPSV